MLATGGLVHPGQFLKAMALGADAVYIGTIALIAMLHTQMAKSMTFEPPQQLVLYTGRHTEDLDVDRAAAKLHNFLQSCTREMEIACYALGKTALPQVSREDLVTTDRDLAEALGIAWAGHAVSAVRLGQPGPAGQGVPVGADGRTG